MVLAEAPHGRQSLYPLAWSLTSFHRNMLYKNISKVKDPEVVECSCFSPPGWRQRTSRPEVSLYRAQFGLARQVEGVQTEVRRMAESQAAQLDRHYSLITGELRNTGKEIRQGQKSTEKGMERMEDNLLSLVQEVAEDFCGPRDQSFPLVDPPDAEDLAYLAPWNRHGRWPRLLEIRDELERKPAVKVLESPCPEIPHSPVNGSGDPGEGRDIPHIGCVVVQFKLFTG